MLILISLTIISALLARMCVQQRKKRQEALRRARTGHAYSPSGKRIVLIEARDDMQRIIQS